MELETVRGVSMGDVGLEIRRQIDDVDCSEWALLGANTASNTKGFRDERDLGFRGDLDAETSTAHHRARFLALLTTFLFVKSLAFIPHWAPSTRRTIYLGFALKGAIVVSGWVHSRRGSGVGQSRQRIAPYLN